MDQGRVRKNSREVQAAARALRRNGTPAEEVLWEAVRDRRLEGLRFRRQHPAGDFIFDFYCPIAKLVVEIDGDVHLEQPERDAARDAKVATFGYHTLRIRNEEVLHDLPAVLARIGALAVERRALFRGRGKFRKAP